MSTTVKAIIDSALRKFGGIATGEQADPAEYADGLTALRMMLDTWSLEPLMVPFDVTEQFDLDPAKAFYSIGEGGDFDTVRPEAILYVRILDAAGFSRPVKPTQKSELNFQSSVQAGIPCRYVVSRDSRWLWLELDAYPTDPSILITSRKPFNAQALENFALPVSEEEEEELPIYPSGFTLSGIQTPIEFPTGYEQAIVYNLALHLHAEYPGLELPPAVVGLAAQSKALIKRANWQPTLLRPDPALTAPRRRGHYDVNAGPW